MLSSLVEQELHQHLEVLPLTQQRQVPDFACALSLAQPNGFPGSALLSFAGAIEADDLLIMSQAADEDCEQIVQLSSGPSSC